jgi:FAD/FMN-containing dehydrogenase
MTAVDVHGATLDAPIFAETVSAFNILLADGTVTTINAKSPAVGGWSPLQFARVSLGGLGVVTSITIDVLERPWKETLQGGIEQVRLANKSDFVKKFKALVGEHTQTVSSTTNSCVVCWDRSCRCHEAEAYALGATKARRSCLSRVRLPK